MRGPAQDKAYLTRTNMQEENSCSQLPRSIMHSLTMPQKKKGFAETKCCMLCLLLMRLKSQYQPH